jgi:hypothetical protein
MDRLLFRPTSAIPETKIINSSFITGWERSAVRKPRDWSKVIDKLNRSKTGELRVKMGSPGSAQVTRCRLLAQWANLEAETVGATLVLRLPR